MRKALNTVLGDNGPVNLLKILDNPVSKTLFNILGLDELKLLPFDNLQHELITERERLLSFKRLKWPIRPNKRLHLKMLSCL